MFSDILVGIPLFISSEKYWKLHMIKSILYGPQECCGILVFSIQQLLLFCLTHSDFAPQRAFLRGFLVMQSKWICHQTNPRCVYSNQTSIVANTWRCCLIKKVKLLINSVLVSPQPLWNFQVNSKACFFWRQDLVRKSFKTVMGQTVGDSWTNIAAG